VSPLHITNGDCAANTLRTFLGDRVLITCDVLHDGPAPAVDGDAWYETRARFLTDGFGARYEETRASLARFDRMIADAAPDQEIVLWFEHDLFDQLLLIRTLDVVVRLKPDATSETYEAVRLKPDATYRRDRSETNARDRSETTVASGFSRTNVSLICIDRFPGVERFVGLGQLNAEQLASLYPARQAVSAEQFALASEAWRAFRASDPRDLFALMVRLKADATYGGSTVGLKVDGTGDANLSPVASGFSRTNGVTLRFLHGAIHRLFEEYPSTTSGLSRSADAVLRALESGPLDGIALFRATQWGEQRPFMGDLGLFDVALRLAAARVPLVTVDPATSPRKLHTSTMQLTDAGREVAAGRQDAVALNGIDEWRGGVHLLGGNQSPWRWNARAETLVQ
jgi:hypothetical protein